jgi:antitoxin ParD1/3/4
MSSLSILIRDQERREASIQELRIILDCAEQGGVSERSLSEVLDAARKEARQKGLSLDVD